MKEEKDLDDAIALAWRCGDISWDVMRILERLLERIEKLEKKCNDHIRS